MTIPPARSRPIMKLAGWNPASHPRGYHGQWMRVMGTVDDMRHTVTGHQVTYEPETRDYRLRDSAGRPISSHRTSRDALAVHRELLSNRRPYIQRLAAEMRQPQDTHHRRVKKDAPYPIFVGDRVAKSRPDLSLGGLGTVADLGADTDGAILHAVVWDDDGSVTWERGFNVRCLKMAQEPTGTQPLWHTPGLHLPAYIQHVWHDLPPSPMRYGLAVGIVRNWSEGHDGHGHAVSAETQTKARAAMVEWEADKAKAHAHVSKAGWTENLHPRGLHGRWVHGMVKPLNESEEASAEDWISSEGDNIQRELRSGHPSEVALEYVKDLDAMIARAKPLPQMRLYRVMTQKLNVGDVVYEPGYLATTTDSGEIPKMITNSDGKGKAYKVNVPAGTRGMYLLGTSELTSAHGMDEFIGHEVLLERGLSFKVIDANTIEIISGVTKSAEHKGCMVALYPDAATARKLAVRGGEPAKDLHVTLAYLGPAKDVAEAKVNAAAAIAAKTLQPITGKVSGPGRFDGPEGQVHVALVDAPGLNEARAHLVSKLQALPVAEDHGFTPHITLQYGALPSGSTSDPPPLSSTLTLPSGNTPLKFDKLVVAHGGRRTEHKLGGVRKDEMTTSDIGGADEAPLSLAQAGNTGKAKLCDVCGRDMPCPLHGGSQPLPPARSRPLRRRKR